MRLYTLDFGKVRFKVSTPHLSIMMLPALFAHGLPPKWAAYPIGSTTRTVFKKEYVFAPNKGAQPKFFEKKGIAFCG